MPDALPNNAPLDPPARETPRPPDPRAFPHAPGADAATAFTPDALPGNAPLDAAARETRRSPDVSPFPDAPGADVAASPPARPADAVGSTTSREFDAARAEAFDAQSCKDSERLQYAKPGCGAAAAPACWPKVWDGCLGYVCGCDGKTLPGCGLYDAPWSTWGPCPQDCTSPSLPPAPGRSPAGCLCDPAKDRDTCVRTASGSWAHFRCYGSWFWSTAEGVCSGDGGI
jgi:hypothetical protein